MLSIARWALMLVGGTATTLGVLGTVYLFAPQDAARGSGDGWRFLADLGPPLGVLGLITLLFATLGPRRWRVLVLAVGLLLLAIGVDPWLYTPALMHDRPDGEAAGMIGTIIFILVGWPGLVMSCTGASLLLGRRIAGRRARLAQAASSSTPA